MGNSRTDRRSSSLAVVPGGLGGLAGLGRLLDLELDPVLEIFHRVGELAEIAVATVDENGLVTAVNVNGCTDLSVVAASVDGPSASTEFMVNPILVTSVTIVDSDGMTFPDDVLELVNFACSLNTTFQLFTSVLPANATDNTVTWSVTSGTVVTVNSSSGLVTFGNPTGDAMITATANDGSGVTYTIQITIIEPC